MSTLDNTAVSVHLGKTSAYEKHYNPALLVRELRAANRKHIALDNDNLPFVGYDIWNAYEVSCLLENGQPVTFVAKIVYICNNDYIVESKSLKLYLNSFNMTKMGIIPKDAMRNLQTTISEDLSGLLDTFVEVRLIDVATHRSANVLYFADFTNLESTVNCNNIVFKDYVETPDLLKGTRIESIKSYKLHSSLLKSNCRVTSQPDWGDVYINMTSKYELNLQSLLQYIVSFRDECHFHEEITETIFKRLYDKFLPIDLNVTCLYVRRGGIDINPTRSMNAAMLYNTLIDLSIPFSKTIRQ